MRRRSPTVALGLTAALATALTGCASVTVPSQEAAVTGQATEWATGSDIVVDEGAEAPSDVDDDADDDDDDEVGQEAPVEYAGVCADQASGERVDDEQCAGVDPTTQTQAVAHGHGSIVPGLVAWYFLRNGLAAPRVGARVAGGSFAAPSTSSFVSGGVPRTGGRVTASDLPGARTTRSTVTRGGFGSAAKGGSGRVGG